MNEVKTLRRVDFPESVVEALRMLERLCISETMQTNPQLDLLNSISEEFIFLEVDRRGNKRKLTSVKELQVLERLSTYFSDNKIDPQCQSHVFLYLFLPGKRLGEMRLSLLTKLVSVAVADLNANILNFSGMWMQMSDCKSEQALHLADIIVKDYFLLMPSLVSSLKTIPLIAPLFCSSFLSCLGILYEPLKIPPPRIIIELTLDWLNSSPYLCFSPLKVPLSQKTFGPQTPISGLIRWCTLAPLTNIGYENNAMYSQLHQVLLETMLGFSEREPLMQMRVKYLSIPYQSIISIIDSLKKYSQHENIQLSLDRFAQVVQIALTSHCLEAVPEIFNQWSTLPLPQTRLSKIVIDKWGKTAASMK